MKVDFEWNRPIQAIAGDIIDEDVQLFTANEAKRFMDKYVPADELMLAQNVKVYVEEECGIVEYASPYAHYQYEGVLYVSSKTGSSWAKDGEYKIRDPEGRALKYQTYRHPLATSHWDRAMITVRKSDIAKAVQNYIGSRR